MQKNPSSQPVVSACHIAIALPSPWAACCRRQQLDAERLRAGRPVAEVVSGPWTGTPPSGSTASRWLRLPSACCSRAPMRATPFRATAYLAPAASSSPPPRGRRWRRRAARRSPALGRRSGEARHAAEAASRRRPRADGEPNADRGWTVFEIPSTPGSLPAVGSRSCGPHHAGSTQSGMRSSSPSPVASPGSARELGVVPHRRPDPDGAAPALSLGGKWLPIEDAGGLAGSSFKRREKLSAWMCKWKILWLSVVIIVACSEARI